MPDRVKNNNTLLGVDSNMNGVRDDLDIIINRNFKDYNERMAAREFVRSFKNWYAICDKKSHDSMIIIPTILEIESAIECLKFINTQTNVLLIAHLKLINKILFNNTARENCFDYYKELSSKYQSNVNNHSKCKFPIKNYESIQKNFKNN